MRRPSPDGLISVYASIVSTMSAAIADNFPSFMQWSMSIAATESNIPIPIPSKPFALAAAVFSGANVLRSVLSPLYCGLFGLYGIFVLRPFWSVSYRQTLNSPCSRRYAGMFSIFVMVSIFLSLKFQAQAVIITTVRPLWCAASGLPCTLSRLRQSFFLLPAGSMFKYQ